MSPFMRTCVRACVSGKMKYTPGRIRACFGVNSRISRPDGWDFVRWRCERRPSLRSRRLLAPAAGFGPAVDCSTPVFETGTFDRSDMLAFTSVGHGAKRRGRALRAFCICLARPTCAPVRLSVTNPQRRKKSYLKKTAAARPGPTLLVQMPMIWRRAAAWSGMAHLRQHRAISTSAAGMMPAAWSEYLVMTLRATRARFGAEGAVMPVPSAYFRPAVPAGRADSIHIMLLRFSARIPARYDFKSSAPKG